MDLIFLLVVKKLNERIKKLRTQSRKAVPYLSYERALLMTEFYKKGAAHRFSAPVARAEAFKYLMENSKGPLKAKITREKQILTITLHPE